MPWGKLDLHQGILNLHRGRLTLPRGILTLPLVRFDSGRGGFDPERGRAKMPSGAFKRKPRASSFGSLRRDDKPARRVLSRQRTTSDWHIHGAKGYAQNPVKVATSAPYIKK